MTHLLLALTQLKTVFTDFILYSSQVVAIRVTETAAISITDTNIFYNSTQYSRVVSGV